MHLPYVQEYVRERAERVESPYNPASTHTDWKNPERITVVGFLDTGATADVSTDPNRDQIVSTAELHLPDANADVRLDDRIRDGDRLWTVDGFPSADVNPFTGWQPVRVVRLKEVRG